MSSSSFTAKRLNASTILITEDDIYGEHPFIYVKIHPKAPVLIVGDTGCDKPSKHKTHGMQDCIHDIKFCLVMASRYKSSLGINIHNFTTDHMYSVSSNMI
jgi:hypothetical protein